MSLFITSVRLVELLLNGRFAQQNDELLVEWEYLLEQIVRSALHESLQFLDQNVCPLSGQFNIACNAIVERREMSGRTDLEWNPRTVRS